MGLIVRGTLQISGVYPSGAVGIYMRVLRRYLSVPYKLITGTIITGEIMKVERIFSGRTPLSPTEVVSGLEYNPIEFILSTYPLGDYDELYISESVWPELRDNYGIIPEEYVFQVKLTKAILEGEEIKIYPMKDIIHP
ncbi:hypothetical protein DRP04_01975 [Archaeoglobales archaeon]|nr:MAG: hypothetical protein DRP04_01975 [Archaeoglobales archaeon]